MIRFLDAHPWAVFAIVGVACVWFALWCLIVVSARADVMGCDAPESPQGRHCDCYREAGEACCWCARKSPFAEPS